MSQPFDEDGAENASGNDREAWGPVRDSGRNAAKFERPAPGCPIEAASLPACRRPSPGPDLIFDPGTPSERPVFPGERRATPRRDRSIARDSGW